MISRFSHEQRIARAAELAKTRVETREILDFFAQITRFQKRIFDDVSARSVTDVEYLAAYFPDLLKLLERIAPAELLASAEPLRNEAALRELLCNCWSGGSTGSRGPEDWFFGRALAQPFAESLASRGAAFPQPEDRESEGRNANCPFCGAAAGVAILRGEGDGGKRSLLCSLCSTEWLFRRILCPNCGEEDKEKLPVYIAAEFDHVRVEACDACKCYVKAIDLTKNGLAIPVVDEIATVPLSMWAEEHGYTKICPNLLAT